MSNLKVEILRWSVTLARRGVKVKSDTFSYEYVDNLDSVVVNVPKLYVPISLQAYWEEVEYFWSIHQEALNEIREYYPNAGTSINFWVTNDKTYPFPDWLHSQLIKRWGWDRIGILNDDERFIRIIAYNATGVRPSQDSAVNAHLTWEQWEQLLDWVQNEQPG